MFVRLYITAQNEPEAKENLITVLQKLKSILIKTNVEKLEPYWKFDDMYVVELSLEVKRDLIFSELRYLLESISDRWESYGEPINELLASKTVEDCNYILKSVEMINIYLDDYDLQNKLT